MHMQLRIIEYIKWNVYNSFNRVVTVTVWKKKERKTFNQKNDNLFVNQADVAYYLNCA